MARTHAAGLDPANDHRITAQSGLAVINSVQEHDKGDLRLSQVCLDPNYPTASPDRQTPAVPAFNILKTMAQRTLLGAGLSLESTTVLWHGNQALFCPADYSKHLF